MKNFSNINFKKIIPGLISIVIVVGMFAQTFATNLDGIDLNAFVTNDEFETKYNELVFRTEDVEKSLERLYKFTCTNVKTYGGINPDYALEKIIFYQVNGNKSNTYPFNTYFGLDLNQDKYMRLIRSFPGTFADLTRRKTHTFVYEVPASLCNWREGVELKPNTMVRITATRDTEGLYNYQTAYTMIMGPFKKFPHIATTGQTKATGLVCELPNLPLYSAPSPTGFAYAYGKETEPTSWTTGTGVMGLSNSTRGSANYSWFPRRTDPEGIKKYAYTQQGTGTVQLLYVSTVHTNLSSYENVWLKYTYTYTNGSDSEGFDRYMAMDSFNLTTWNTGK